MSCNTLRLKRGYPTIYYYTVLDENGDLRPFADGEYAVMAVGRVTATGAALVTLDTRNPAQGETTVGSAVASFLFSESTTNVSLPGVNYQADIAIGGNASSPIAIDDVISVTIDGRVNPSPPSS